MNDGGDAGADDAGGGGGFGGGGDFGSGDYEPLVMLVLTVVPLAVCLNQHQCKGSY